MKNKTPETQIQDVLSGIKIPKALAGVKAIFDTKVLLAVEKLKDRGYVSVDVDGSHILIFQTDYLRRLLKESKKLKDRDEVVVIVACETVEEQKT